jgi:hypothetical protein
MKRRQRRLIFGIIVALIADATCVGWWYAKYCRPEPDPDLGIAVHGNGLWLDDPAVAAALKEANDHARKAP